MSRRILAVMGLLLLIGAAALVLRQQQLARAALGRDSLTIDDPPSNVIGEFPQCELPLVMIALPARVMTAGQSQALAVEVANRFNDETCQTQLQLSAAGFDVSPPLLVQDIETLKPAETATRTWTVAPREPGEFVLAVSAGGETRVLGLTVTTILGLTAAQAEVVSLIGTLLGPLLTVPWWIERWEKYKERRARPAPAPTKAADG